MKNKFIFRFLIFVFPLLLWSCGDFGAFMLLFGEDNVDERSPYIKELTDSLDLPVLPADTDGVYSAVVVTDVHFGNRFDEKTERRKFIKWMEESFYNPDKTKIPRFMVCLGDTGNSGDTSEYEEYNAFIEEIKEKAKTALGSDFNFMVYTIAGNHDLYNNGWNNWKKNIYPYTSSYRFSAGTGNGYMDFSFYFLDSANGTLGKKQLDDFKSKIKNDKKAKLIFTHYPIFSGTETQLVVFDDTMERNLLLSLCAKNDVKMIFGGHSHKNFSYDLGSFSQENTASLFQKGYLRTVLIDEKTGSVTSRLVEY